MAYLTQTQSGQPVLVLKEGSSRNRGKEVIASGECIILTSKNTKLYSLNKFAKSLVSGWAIWSRRNEKNFALSDHADFNQLLDFVEACNPKTVLTCFGGKKDLIFAEQVEKRLKIESRPLKLIGNKFLLN